MQDRSLRIGIIGLLHESNTFVQQKTSIEAFHSNLLLTDKAAITEHFREGHHEISGFFRGLRDANLSAAEAQIECVPIFVARALPSGIIDATSWQTLTDMLMQQLEQAGDLDGLLVAPHGATVAEQHPDADGHWLSLVRGYLGNDVIIGGTLDLHANLSQRMVDACDFLTAYRTNPHLDQRDRGEEAARLMIDAVSGRTRPVMVAARPPLAISIDRQDTSASWLQEVYELVEVACAKTMLSASLLLGFPYADVEEMGAATIAVSNGSRETALSAADALAGAFVRRREQYRGNLLDVDEAITECQSLRGPVCLLDMGDNVGGGSSADGTFVLRALMNREVTAFVCLFDPDAVRQAEESGVGSTIAMELGGKSDTFHGLPVQADCKVESLHDGKFSEAQPRHGGMTQFDQGRTAIVKLASRGDQQITVMLTSRRMVPFSLAQLTTCDVNPADFDIIVAKGVHAPLAAYREVCPSFVRASTPGSTCADMHQLTYHHRRRPLFPLEDPFS